MAPVHDAHGELAYFFASQLDVTLERERLVGLETRNAALIAELRAIAFVQRLIEEDNLKGHAVNRLSRIHVHMIGSETDMLALGTSSKYNIDFEFLSHLKELGRSCAENWLTDNWHAVGQNCRTPALASCCRWWLMSRCLL